MSEAKNEPSLLDPNFDFASLERDALAARDIKEGRRPARDDWSYQGRTSVILDYLEIEIIDEPMPDPAS